MNEVNGKTYVQVQEINYKYSGGLNQQLYTWMEKSWWLQISTNYIWKEKMFWKPSKYSWTTLKRNIWTSSAVLLKATKLQYMYTHLQPVLCWKLLWSIDTSFRLWLRWHLLWGAFWFLGYIHLSWHLTHHIETEIYLWISPTRLNPCGQEYVRSWYPNTRPSACHVLVFKAHFVLINPIVCTNQTSRCEVFGFGD